MDGKGLVEITLAIDENGKPLSVTTSGAINNDPGDVIALFCERHALAFIRPGSVAIGGELYGDAYPGGKPVGAQELIPAKPNASSA